MAKFNADKIYFDELIAGIGAEVHLDDNNRFDAAYNTQITGVFEVTLAQQKMTASEILDINIIGDFSVDEDYSSFIDLLQLVPTKFRESVLLQEYFQDVGTLVGTWLGDINDLATLVDKYRVSEDYLQKLADLVNLTILSNEDTSLVEKRRQLIQVIEWYKLKGTYKALQYIGYLLGVTLTLWDMYTDDYVTFVEEPWFVGYEGENPGGLGVGYYKSPHLGLETVLDTAYGTGLTSYLFLASMYVNLTTYVELVRPINVVPHYKLLLSPETDQTGDVETVAGNIQTCVVGNWMFSRRYFDATQILTVVTTGSNDVVTKELDNVIVNSSDPMYFDNGEFFDFTDDAFYNQITKWKVGTGSKGIPPANSGWNLETVALTGTVDTINVYADRIEYIFELPNTVTITGISELGLFLAVGNVLEVGATFPNIDVIPGITLKILVTIQRT